ncbi:MAG: hypothetical protein LBG30_07655 [Odoribacteraceae bacterium]|jgi:hypothetical protein|nr:hypothetical protein [Odoribacteraceae bacterium]
MKKRTYILLAIVALLASISPARAQREAFFDRDYLPSPVFPQFPDLVNLYWKAWEQAWQQVKNTPGTTRERYFHCDLVLELLPLRYAPRLFPGVETLDRLHETLLDPSALLLAWVESEFYRFSGNEQRLQLLLTRKQYLQRHFSLVDSSATSREGLSRQALAALHVARLAGEINQKEISRNFNSRYKSLKATLNKQFPDLDATDLRPLCLDMLAEVPTLDQARRVAALARRENSRDARDSSLFPLDYISIKSLERYHFLEEADDAAYLLLQHRHELFSMQPSSSPLPLLLHVSLFIENVLGFHRVDAVNRVVEWRKHHRGLHGIRNLSFGDVTADIIGDDHAIQVQTNGPFTLIVNGKTHRVRKGTNTFK